MKAYRRIQFVTTSTLQQFAIAAAIGDRYAQFLDIAKDNDLVSWQVGTATTPEWLLRIRDDRSIAYGNSELAPISLQAAMNVYPPIDGLTDKSWVIPSDGQRYRRWNLDFESTTATPKSLFVSAATLRDHQEGGHSPADDPKYWEKTRFYPWYGTFTINFPIGVATQALTIDCNRTTYIQGLRSYGSWTGVPNLVHLRSSSEISGPGLTNQPMEYTCLGYWPILTLEAATWPGVYPIQRGEQLLLDIERDGIGTAASGQLVVWGVQAW